MEESKKSKILKIETEVKYIYDYANDRYILDKDESFKNVPSELEFEKKIEPEAIFDLKKEEITDLIEGISYFMRNTDDEVKYQKFDLLKEKLNKALDDIELLRDVTNEEEVL